MGPGSPVSSGHARRPQGQGRCLLGQEGAFLSSPQRKALFKASLDESPAACLRGPVPRRLDAMMLECETKYLLNKRSRQQAEQREDVLTCCMRRLSQEDLHQATDVMVAEGRGWLKQLNLIEQQNVELAHDMNIAEAAASAQAATQAMASAQAQAASSAAAAAASTAAANDRAHALQMIQSQLQTCQERQARIKAQHQAKMQQLHEKLARAREGQACASPGASPSASPTRSARAAACEQELAQVVSALGAAGATRRELTSRLNQLRTLPREPPVDALADTQGLQHEACLDALRQALFQEEEEEKAAKRAAKTGDEEATREEVSAELRRLYEELDDLRSTRENERVCSESELRELKAERDGCSDRLDDEKAEVRRLRAQIQELRDIREGRSDISPSAAAIAARADREAAQRRELEVQEEAALREAEAAQLELLEAETVREEAMKGKVAELEREQEEVVNDMFRFSTQMALAEGLSGGGGQVDLAQALEVELADLEGQLAGTQAAHQALEGELDTCRKQVEATKVRSSELRKEYVEFQRNSDERTRTTPRTTPTHSRVSLRFTSDEGEDNSYACVTSSFTGTAVS